MIRKLGKGLAGLLLLRQFVRFLAHLRGRRATAAEGEPSGSDALSGGPESHPLNLRRRFLVSLSIGVAIQVALIVGHSFELPILIATEDAAMDFVMRQFRNVKRDEDTAFVLLEADQVTFENWEEPFYFHRDRVQEMIQFASGFELNDEQTAATDVPALIIVDIDLGKQGSDDGSDELKAYLQRYSTASNPPLVLARTLQTWPVDESEGAIPRERASYLDLVISDPPNRNIFWASPHFQRDDDYRIRRWLLWQQTRVGPNLSVLPSVQLLSQVLLSKEQGEGEPTPAAVRYGSLIEQLREISSCDTGKATRPALTIYPGGKERRIDLCSTFTSQRLVYTIPYAIPEGELRPKVTGGAPVLQRVRVPAMGLSALDRGLLADSVVVIGGTYRETRDWHATPLGEMPGAMVVINAIHSLGAHGQLERPSGLMRLLIVVLLITLAALLFARLSGFLAYLAVSAFMLVLLVPVSFLMFRSGVWLDFALPLLAAQIHEFIAEFEAIKPRSAEMPSGPASIEPADPEVVAQSTEAATNDDDAAV